MSALPRTRRAKLRAGRGTQRAMSQRPPDARITGGFAAILLKSIQNAKRLLRISAGCKSSVSAQVARAGAPGVVALAR